MPRKRNPENEGLPSRWRIYHKAYYYHVPPGQEQYWDHRRQFRLGDTYEEAMEVFMAKTGESGRAEDIPDAELLDEKAIVNNSIPFSSEGVYFLIRDGRIVYVGRSINVAARVASHVSHHEMRFERVFFIPATGDRKVRLEQRYINKFKPENNAYHTESIAHLE